MKKMKTIKQLFRFGLVGGLATIVHVCVATILIKFFVFSQVAANCSAFISANYISYVGHTKFSFIHSFTKTTLIRYIVVTSICFFATALVAKIAEFFSLTYQIGIILVLCTIPVISYLLHRFWTYK